MATRVVSVHVEKQQLLMGRSHGLSAHRAAFPLTPNTTLLSCSGTFLRYPSCSRPCLEKYPAVFMSYKVTMSCDSDSVISEKLGKE